MSLSGDFYAIVFFSTTDTIATERKLKKDYKVMIMPTPREISESCGFAIRFGGEETEAILAAMDDVEVDHAIYHLGPKGEDGKRQCELIKTNK